MIGILWLAEVAPFTIALSFFFALFLLELVFLTLGGSLLGADGGEVELDAEFDAPDLTTLDLPDLPDMDVDLSGYELAGYEPASEAEMPSAAAPGPLTWLGVGKVPALIWLSAFLIGYGVSGLGAQLAVQSVFGAMLPAWAMGLLVLPVGLAFARGFGHQLARLVPKTKTEVLSSRNLGRRRGFVSQGVARAGKPAEVRVVDGYGNFHYVRAEPMDPKDEIRKGTEVLVLRDRRSGDFRIIPLA